MFMFLMFLALSWRIEYQSLYRPSKGAVSTCWGAGHRLRSAAHPCEVLSSFWAEYCEIDTRLKHVVGNLRVSASRSQSLLGKEICTESA